MRSQKEQVFVTGHKNPDMDSICSSWAYSRLKNVTDPTRYYVPIRQHMNEMTKAQLQRLGVDPPMYVPNIKPRIYDIIINCDDTLDVNDPIYSLCKYFSEKTLPVVPIFDGENYETLLPVDDITSYFLSTNSHTHPILNFSIENIGKLIRGRYLKKGEINEFKTTIAIGMMKYEKYENFMKHLPGPMPIVMVGNRRKHLELAVEMKCPAIIVVGLGHDEELACDISQFEGTVFAADDDSDKTLQLLKMSIPIKYLLTNSKPPIVRPYDLFDEVKEILAGANFRALPVLNDEGQFYGIIMRSSFLVRPKKKLIMMDHNEMNQGIPGIEDAEIFEIIDHHRLAAEKTQTPIYMDIEPLGSTCTLVYGLYRKNEVEIDQETALVLLSGIVSDTVMLKSPTTTQTDREVVHKLTRIAQIKSLKEFGDEMFSGGANVATQDPRKAITADFKTFNENGVDFGIGQVEVGTFTGIADIKQKWLAVLEEIKKENNLQWALFVFTNINLEASIILSTPFPLGEKRLKYEKTGDGEYYGPGVLSRKIQILPEVTRCLANED